MTLLALWSLVVVLRSVRCRRRCCSRPGLSRSLRRRRRRRSRAFDILLVRPHQQWPHIPMRARLVRHHDPAAPACELYANISGPHAGDRYRVSVRECVCVCAAFMIASKITSSSLTRWRHARTRDRVGDLMATEHLHPISRPRSFIVPIRAMRRRIMWREDCCCWGCERCRLACLRFAHIHNMLYRYSTIFCSNLYKTAIINVPTPLVKLMHIHYLSFLASQSRWLHLFYVARLSHETMYYYNGGNQCYFIFDRV